MGYTVVKDHKSLSFYLSSILSNPYPSGFNNFYRRSEQRAETLMLDEAEDYLLVAEFKEGGGDDYMQVSAYHCTQRAAH